MRIAKTRIGWACVIALLPATSALAVDFTEADAAFALRGESLELADAARAKYEAHLGSSIDTEDKIYAVSQIGRLDAYMGEKIGDGNLNDRRLGIYNHCLETVTQIAPAAIGREAVEYYYFKALCLASWGRTMRDKGRASWNAALQRTPELKDIHEKYVMLKEKDDPRELDYEGGGLYRVLGAVFYNLPLANIAAPGFVRNFAEAARFLKAAIASPPHESSEDPAWGAGEHYVANYYHLALLYFEMAEYASSDAEKKAHLADSRKTAELAIAKFGDPQMAPVSRAAENTVGVRNLRALLQRPQFSGQGN